MLQGDESCFPIITYHDIATNRECTQNVIHVKFHVQMKRVLMACLAYRTWCNCFISSAGTTSMHQDKSGTKNIPTYMYVKLFIIGIKCPAFCG